MADARHPSTAHRSGDRAGRPPAVSVIIAFLDAERFLGEAIDSVAGQTSGDWELLLVDDGSSDGSSAIARRAAMADPERVICLEHPGHANRGLSASRNLGIRHARGELTAFLDADDVWLPHKLEDQVPSLLSRSGVAMLYGRTEYWRSWTGAAGPAGADTLQPHFMAGERVIPPPRLLELYLEGRAAIPPPSSVLVRRTALEAIGGFEESFPGMYEDQAFYAKLTLRYAAYVAAGCWERYRQHAESMCATAADAGELMQARLAFLEWLEAHLRDHGGGSSRLERMVSRELWLCRHPRAGRPLGRARRFLRKLRRRLGPSSGIGRRD